MSQPQTQPSRVLVVDDSEAILERTRDALTAVGIDVITTSRPTQVAKDVSRCDLVIIDYHMPGITGAELLKQLREVKGPLPQYYLFTTDPAVAAAHESMGFDGCIFVKGDDRALVAQVQAALQLAKLRALRARRSP